MGDLYTLGNRARGKRKSVLVRVLFLMLAVSLAMLLVFNRLLYPGIASLASAAAQDRVRACIASAYLAQTADDALAYDDLIAIRYHTDGSVSSVSCHMAKLNRARNEMLLSVLKDLSSKEEMKVALPLGSVLGGELFSGQGPSVEVELILGQNTRAYMESEFTAVGINQTLHRILFTVSVNITVLAPTRPIHIEVVTQYCVAETIIVGKVPDAYTEIDRLTDDITEEELNDLYDFGAS